MPRGTQDSASRLHDRTASRITCFQGLHMIWPAEDNAGFVGKRVSECYSVVQSWESKGQRAPAHANAAAKQNCCELPLLGWDLSGGL